MEKETIEGAAAKYGWQAVQEGNAWVLLNQRRKRVCAVTQKGGQYQISDIGGNILLSGKKSVTGAIETVLKEYYFAKPILPANPKTANF